MATLRDTLLKAVEELRERQTALRAYIDEEMDLIDEDLDSLEALVDDQLLDGYDVDEEGDEVSDAKEED